jgi:hypothetical protein
MRLWMAGLLLIAACPALAQTRVLQHHTFHISGDADKDLRVVAYADFGRDCRAFPPPKVTLRTQPVHGVVAIRPGKSTIKFIRPDAPDCINKEYDGTAIWYTPAAGFHGTETFEVQVAYRDSVSNDTQVIEVR